jgi:tight adherence protein B
MSSITTIAAAATSALAVVLLFMGGLVAWGNRSSSVAGRLQRWGTKSVEQEKPKEKRIKGDMSAVGGFLVTQVNRAVAQQSFADKIQRRLARADLKITVGEFLIINVATVLMGALLGAFVFGTTVHAIVCTAAGLILPHWYVRMKQASRLKKFNNQLADTIAMLANSLRSGYSMLQSMDLVSREMPPPICDEFQRVTREVGLGLTPEEALSNLVRRINSTDLDLMVTAINVQREVGGNLSEVLDVIAHTIRERVKLQGEIKTLTAQQTMAGYIITALPFILFLFLYTIDPKYMSVFWTWIPCGLIMAGVSLIMMSIGFYAMRKIVAIEV